MVNNCIKGIMLLVKEPQIGFGVIVFSLILLGCVFVASMLEFFKDPSLPALGGLISILMLIVSAFIMIAIY